jgi:hypothetical protein
MCCRLGNLREAVTAPYILSIRASRFLRLYKTEIADILCSMATTTAAADIEVKATSDMLEHTVTADAGCLSSKQAALDAEAKGQGVSGYETLTLWQTLKAFKVNTAVCFAVTFSAAADGYQIGSV